MKKREKLEIIRKYYPNALTTIDFINKIIDYIEEELDLEPAEIMFADSICSDDVNSIQYPVRTNEFLGPFKMGGLDGFPFTGLTGMQAFASHVPDNGAVFIYYGPHIGISKEGTIGEINRFGQHKPSSCCGAAHGALNKLLDNTIQPGHITEIDYQMNTIEQILYNQKDKIINAEIPLYEATEIIYESIDNRIQQLIESTKYNCKYVILVGAVLINSDSDIGSFSSTKRFDVIDLKKGTRQNVLSTLHLTL
ncbi:hypothetical protein L1276_004202 [Flavobacterium sp. HSC-32F16]|uniref:hypothetical protein n=1 Tax=Flavobacterium sp. HSC-32F16 TaxID=2910964 RepID=UPI0020A5A2DC|nr:hypothetical protein [Flavobacterium sp. HSC-32F16]MCP2029023.1 hypothetical protein [Flavobacterium sp. HSC-32F16]